MVGCNTGIQTKYYISPCCHISIRFSFHRLKRVYWKCPIIIMKEWWRGWYLRRKEEKIVQEEDSGCLKCLIHTLAFAPFCKSTKMKLKGFKIFKRFQREMELERRWEVSKPGSWKHLEEWQWTLHTGELGPVTQLWETQDLDAPVSFSNKHGMKLKTGSGGQSATEVLIAPDAKVSPWVHLYPGKWLEVPLRWGQSAGAEDTRHSWGVEEVCITNPVQESLE